MPNVMRNKSGSLASNKTMVLIFKTGIICLTLCLGAVVCLTQERRNTAADDSQDEGAAVGFRCPGRELNQPRPDVKLSLGDVTKKALELPQPEYSRAARTARVPGNVQAEVVIDINTGRVVWARVLNSHSLLREAVSNVVCRARFAPMNDVDVRVSGILTYRFAQRR